MDDLMEILIPFGLTIAVVIGIPYAMYTGRESTNRTMNAASAGSSLMCFGYEDERVYIPNKYIKLVGRNVIDTRRGIVYHADGCMVTR